MRRVSEDLDAAAGCDAAVIATPTAFHEVAARALIELGKPLLVEKPVTPDLEIEPRARRVRRASRGAPDVRVRRAIQPGGRDDAGPPRRGADPHRRAAPLAGDPAEHAERGLRPAHPRDRPRARVHGRRHARPRSAARRAPPGRHPIVEVADCVLQLPERMRSRRSPRAAPASARCAPSSSRPPPRSTTSTCSARTSPCTATAPTSRVSAPAAGYRAETVIDIPFVRHTGEPLALQFRHFLDLVDGTGRCVQGTQLDPPRPRDRRRHRGVRHERADASATSSRCTTRWRTCAGRCACSSSGSVICPAPRSSSSRTARRTAPVRSASRSLQCSTGPRMSGARHDVGQGPRVRVAARHGDGAWRAARAHRGRPPLRIHRPRRLPRHETRARRSSWGRRPIPNRQIETSLTPRGRCRPGSACCRQGLVGLDRRHAGHRAHQPGRSRPPCSRACRPATS